MQVPEKIDKEWISSLNDDELKLAESGLRENFAAEEQAERKRRGPRYELMRGPETLLRAWMRWSMVNTAALDRGLTVKYRH